MWPWPHAQHTTADRFSLALRGPLPLPPSQGRALASCAGASLGSWVTHQRATMANHNMSRLTWGETGWHWLAVAVAGSSVGGGWTVLDGCLVGSLSWTPWACG